MDYQPFPRTGHLGRNLDLPLVRVRARVGQPDAVVYAYVVATIERRDGHFVQRGSGPNWQGDRLTLCTCKHHLRTFRAPADWPGVWLAGFSGVAAGGGRNALVYLARVGHAFASHAECWDHPAMPARARAAKAAHRHPLGDLFAPLARRGDPTDPLHYRRPGRGHAHERRDGRATALLLADSQHTYLWEQPACYAPNPLGRGQHKANLSTLLDGLETRACSR